MLIRSRALRHPPLKMSSSFQAAGNIASIRMDGADPASIGAVMPIAVDSDGAAPRVGADLADLARADLAAPDMGSAEVAGREDTAEWAAATGAAAMVGAVAVTAVVAMVEAVAATVIAD